MVRNRLIAISARRARRLVKPARLEDVLESLKRDGFITHFLMDEKKIWICPVQGIDAFLFAVDLAEQEDTLPDFSWRKRNEK